jgi:hypothetical protein
MYYEFCAVKLYDLDPHIDVCLVLQQARLSFLPFFVCLIYDLKLRYLGTSQSIGMLYFIIELTEIYINTTDNMDFPVYVNLGLAILILDVQLLLLPFYSCWAAWLDSIQHF